MEVDQKLFKSLKKMKKKDTEPRILKPKVRNIMDILGIPRPPMFPEHEKLQKIKLR